MTKNPRETTLIALRIIATMLIVITALLACYAIAKGPEYEMLYDEMIEGPELPEPAALVMKFWLPCIALVMIATIAALVFLWWSKSFLQVVLVCTGATVLFLATYQFVQSVLFDPIAEMIDKLSQT